MEYRRVGKAAGTFGIKGELKILSFTDFPEKRFAKGNILYFLHNGKYEPVHVKGCRIHKGHTQLTFEEIPDLTAAELYKQDELYADAEDVPELKEGEYFPEEILGMEVRCAGKVLGKVTQVDFLPSHPVIRVSEGKDSILIPFVGAFILEVKEKERTIELNPEEGIV